MAEKGGKLTIVDVMKDMGGAGVGIPVATEMKRRSYALHPIAEGLAAGRAKAAGLDLYFQGTVDWRAKPFTLDAAKVLAKIFPRESDRALGRVVCSMGSPIHLEELFGLAAIGLGIPLINRSDFWGSATRSSARPDLVLAIDEIDACAMREYLGPDAKIAVVGNHAVRPEPIEIPPAVKEQQDRLLGRFGTLILFAGGGDYTTAELKLLKECLAKTPGAWALVPRLHPKWVNTPKPGSEETYGEEWRRILADLGDRITNISSPDGDAVAAACHVTVSGFSTLMTTALDHGRIAIALDTPETRASFKSQTKIFEEYPLIRAGIVPKISAPTDLSAWLGGREPPASVVHRFLKPLDVATAADAIENAARS